MGLLRGFRVLQLGPGLAASVCGRLLADAGASVACEPNAGGGLLAAYLDHAKERDDGRPPI